MYGHAVFAVLTAYDSKNYAASAFKLEHNSRWFHCGRAAVAVTPTIDDREATPALEEAFSPDQLILTFKDLSNLTNGIQFGTNPAACHILLGHRGTKGVSGRQCIITVDDDLRIWLHDHYSTYGTAVGNTLESLDQVRRGETWLLADQPGNPISDKLIRAGLVIFKIHFPNHTTEDPRYIQDLQRLVEGIKDVPSVDGLGPHTVLSTGNKSTIHTPSNNLVYYREECLGHGAFGEVHLLVQARTGNIFAGKFLTTSRAEEQTEEHVVLNHSRKRKRDELAGLHEKALAALRNEYMLLRDSRHANVMEVFEIREIPRPVIIMAYYADGNIANAHITDRTIYMSATGQILDGLVHLHGMGIVHRNLKPANILFQKDPFKVVIADFGLAKLTGPDVLAHTLCGTTRYGAPEIIWARGLGNPYGFNIDIWSLGVTVLDWLGGKMWTVPVQAREMQELRRNYAPVLRYHLCQRDSDIMIAILDRMLVWDPEVRAEAAECLKMGLQNKLFKRRNDGLVAYDVGDTDELLGHIDKEAGICESPIDSEGRLDSHKSSEAPTAIKG